MLVADLAEKPEAAPSPGQIALNVPAEGSQSWAPLRSAEIVVQPLSGVRLCDPMDCSTPGVLVLHYLPDFAHIDVHWLGDAIQPFHPLSPASFLALSLAQHHGLF